MRQIPSMSFCLSSWVTRSLPISLKALNTRFNRLIFFISKSSFTIHPEVWLSVKVYLKVFSNNNKEKRIWNTSYHGGNFNQKSVQFFFGNLYHGSKFRSK